jgi:hypothetical protein
MSDEALEDRVGRGASWIESQVQPDGSIAHCQDDLAGYYKTLLMLAVCGRLAAASQVKAYVRGHFRDGEGNLASPSGRKTGLTRMERNLANYMDGWIAIGAWLLEDFELADQAATSLLRQQSRGHGSVLTGPEKWSGPPRYGLATAASAGRAFLITGHRHGAMAAADFLIEALEHQSDLSSGLDLAFDQSWTALSAPDPSERSYYRFDSAHRGEKVWFPAFSAAFLCEHHQVSGRGADLEAAQRYFEQIRATPEYADKTLANGKSGWAAGLLAEATEEKEYLEPLPSIIVNVLGRQGRDGQFGAAAEPAPGAERPIDPAELPRALERTAEFTTWSAEFLRFIARGLVSVELP